MLMRLRLALPVVVILIAAAVMLAATPAGADNAPQSPQPDAVVQPSLYPSANERVGIGILFSVGDIVSYNVAQLEAGWYGDWMTRSYPPHPNGMDYIPLVNTGNNNYPPNWEMLTVHVQRNPGLLWIVGNEPEGYWQERLTPAQYAQRYHDVYTFIKATDPTAQVAIGGVILPSPLRLKWLDKVLQEYQTRYGVAMPVDVWNTHMQIVNEVSCSYDPNNCWGAEIPVGLTETQGILMQLSDNANYDLFVQLIQGMRTWMNDRGFRNKPLIVSEYGVLLPSDYLCDGCNEDLARGDAIVASFMTRTMSYMLNTIDAAKGMPADGNRLVQRWMWYTLNDQPYNFETGLGFNGGLFDYRNNVYPGTLTYFGRIFKDFVVPLKTPYRELAPSAMSMAVGNCGAYSVTVKVSNTGNTAASNVRVRFYAGDPAAGGVRIGEVIVPSLGIRHSTPAVASLSFRPAAEGEKTIYAVVDPGNAFAEPNENNNKINGTFNFSGSSACANRNMLPVVISTFTVMGQ